MYIHECLVRGGGWYGHTRIDLSSRRASLPCENLGSTLGFRLVKKEKINE